MTQVVIVYTAPDCTLCSRILEDLELLAAEQDLEVRTVDVTTDSALAERYLLLAPVVEVAGGATLPSPISIRQLRSALAAVASYAQ
jgi:thiol-disulfide isomerase/thioredoxin